MAGRAPRSRWRSWLSGPADRTQPSGGPAGSAGVQPDSDFAAADRRRPADVRWSSLWSPGGSSRSPGHRRRHQGSLCPTVATPHGPALRDPVTHRTQSRAQGSHPLSTRGRSIWHTPGLPKPLRGCPLPGTKVLAPQRPSASATSVQTEKAAPCHPVNPKSLPRGPEPTLRGCSKSCHLYPTPRRGTEPSQSSWGARFVPHLLGHIRLQGLVTDLEAEARRAWTRGEPAAPLMTNTLWGDQPPCIEGHCKRRGSCRCVGFC